MGEAISTMSYQLGVVAFFAPFVGAGVTCLVAWWSAHRIR